MLIDVEVDFRSTWLQHGMKIGAKLAPRHVFFHFFMVYMSKIGYHTPTRANMNFNIELKTVILGCVGAVLTFR